VTDRSAQTPTLLRRSILQWAAAAPLVALPTLGLGQTNAAPASTDAFKPRVGQEGKDVIWVPTPDKLVHRMLQMAMVGPNDFVVDLGSGDGKIAIAAARDFKARAMGVEFNPQMVALSRRAAVEAGVAERVQFEEGDIFKVDFSKASVVTMYLLPALNLKLRPTLLSMRPGTRIVSHQFMMGSWEPDDNSNVEDRPGYLWIVPASVGGNWTMTSRGPDGESDAGIAFSQAFQKVSGRVRMGEVNASMRQVRLVGDRIDFEMMDQRGIVRVYDGRVSGERIEGRTVASNGATGSFVATRTGPVLPVETGRE
jgi:SAM-dependent methyltransferase